MSNFDLVPFANDSELAEGAAREFAQELSSLIHGGVPYCIALSGGRIARRFFSAAANLARERRLELDSVHFFWGDERCVTPTDPESNFAMARELFLGPLNIPAE